MKTVEPASSSATNFKNPLADAALSSKSDLVLLDENLLSIMRDRPLYVYEHTKVSLCHSFNKCILSEKIPVKEDGL